MLLMCYRTRISETMIQKHFNSFRGSLGPDDFANLKKVCRPSGNPKIHTGIHSRFLCEVAIIDGIKIKLEFFSLTEL